MARGRTFVSSRRVSKRLTDWAFVVSSSGVTNIPLGSKVLAASLSAAQLAGAAPGTVIRTRGVLHVTSDTTGAGEVQTGAMGIGFVSETARALGVTAISGPDTDALWDGWFVHQFIEQRTLFSSAVGIDMAPGVQYIIDSKAMRKFDGSDGLVVMFENTSATFGYDVVLGLRFLVKAG